MRPRLQGQDLDRAIADYTEAIRLDPTYIFAFNNRGSAFDDKNEYARSPNPAAVIGVIAVSGSVRGDLSSGASIVTFNTMSALFGLFGAL